MMQASEEKICTYCGSLLTLNKFGRCSFCNGPYSYILIQKQDSFSIEPLKHPLSYKVSDRQDYSIETFYTDLIKNKELGLIVGETNTGKTSILSNFIDSISEDLRINVLSQNSRYFKEVYQRVTGNTNKSNVKLFNMFDYDEKKFLDADVYVVDDFEYLFRSFDYGIHSIAKLNSDRNSLLHKLKGKPTIIAVKKLTMLLHFGSKWIATLSKNKDGSVVIDFEIFGRKMELTKLDR